MSPAEILAALPKLSALVVGDVCLDRWCRYDPATAEPSRETGIPRIGVVSTEVTPGAAGTVANNLAALGVGRVAVMGAIGDDGFGVELSKALGRSQISSDLCVRAPGLQTFTYTKLINCATGAEDQPRIDFINTAPLAAEIERRLLDNLQMSADSFDAILISDQAETNQGGVITPAMRELFGELAPVYRDRVFFADSRRRIHLFRNVIVKPNQQEAEESCRELFGRVDYSALLRQVESRLMIVTHGGNGVAVVRPEGEQWVATRKVPDPVDICGAGDSFTAGCAMALAAGASPEEAARFGHMVASITIMKPGTGTASPEEVLAAHEHARD